MWLDNAELANDLCPQLLEPHHLSLHRIGGLKIEMQAILDDLSFRNRVDRKRWSRSSRTTRLDPCTTLRRDSYPSAAIQTAMLAPT